MSKHQRKIRATTVSNRKPWQRLEPAVKSRIIQEILNGSIGQREASRKYNLTRSIVQKWVRKSMLIQLVDKRPKANIKMVHSEMNDSKINNELLQKVRALTKELQYSQLKVEALETMIIVAEEDLKIKIRKKRGTKQSRECDKENPLQA